MWLTVDGDLRFLSHHEMMRAMERLLARAQVPLKYSQGFNPRPRLSLASPRPVGVASQQDLLVAAMDRPLEPAETSAMLERLNAQAPRGLHFTGAQAADGPVAHRPKLAAYELVLEAGQCAQVSERLSALDSQADWPVQRLGPADRRSGARAARTLDLRPLVARLELEGNVLKLELVPQGDLWARPAEVLGLLGLDERADLARLVRTRVEYE